MSGKRGPKGPRNKVKQVLLISGHPSCLFTRKPVNRYSAQFGDRKIELGKISDEVAGFIRSLNQYVSVMKTTKDELRAHGIPGFPGLAIQKRGEDTTILVAADTEENLAAKIEELKLWLEAHGEQVTERCHWSCTVDKGRSSLPVTPTPMPTPMPTPIPTPLPTPMPTPMPIPEGPGKYFCSTRGKEISIPRDCDYCIMKKHCNTFAEFRKKMEEPVITGVKKIEEPPWH